MKKSFYWVHVYNQEGYCFAFYPWVKGIDAVLRIRKKFIGCKVKQKKLT